MPRTIKVVHLTTVHRPFDARIFHKECVSAAEAGFDVTLIQSGETEEQRQGVRVLPLRSRYSRLSRMTAGVWEATRRARALRPDIVHFHDPELMWGALLLKLGGAKVVYDVHENLHLDIAAKQWLPKWSRSFLGMATRLAEWAATLAFDHVSAATDAIGQRFPSRKTSVIRNAPVLDEMRDPAAGIPFEMRPANMIYIGGLGGSGNAHSVELMLQALAALPAESPIRLMLGGPEPEPGFIEQVRHQPGGGRVDYLGWVDREDLARHYGNAIGALVLYPPAPNNIESEPVKLFEAMAAGVPVIISNFPLFVDFIEQWQCGFAVDPFDTESVAEKMMLLHNDRRLAAELGRSGRSVIEKERNWAISAKRLATVYAQLAGAPSKNALASSGR